VHTLLLVLEIVLLAAASLLALPVVVFTIQVASAWLARAPEDDSKLAGVTPLPSRLPATVLMPAHDEAEGITASIVSVRRELGPLDRLLVVADNCSDATAQVARDAGAEVLERVDLARRGKGFALDWGIRHLAAAPPAVVVVVDADCIVAPGAIDRLARRCAETGRPAQAIYLMRSPPAAPLKTRIAEFAWVVKCEVRAFGYHQLGLPCQLLGTGMAFPWALISKAPLASAHIVEDLQLGLDMAAAGASPELCPAALVTSVFPLAAAAIASQRTRWEHGHFDIIAKRAPGLMWQAIRQRRGDLAAMVADLCVPPLAALVLALTAVLVAAAILAKLGAGMAPLAVAGASMLLMLVSVGSAWSRFGRHIVTLRELASSPAYAFAKIPLYAGMLRRKQTEWVRTRRDDRSR
jgi:cellulose synthase/poly-beta-1,6-N-acetylglucosamine synthase-like glycosyltransferase